MYADAIRSLNAGLAFSEVDRSTQQTVRLQHRHHESSLTPVKARLAETGGKKIAQLFTTLVAEACSSALLEPTQYLGSSPSSLPLINADLESSLAPVVDTLHSLPLPATHPSHPASNGNLSTLKEAQDGYAAMRGAWSKRCVEIRSRELINGADREMDGIQISLDFAQWTAGLLLLAEVGYCPCTLIDPDKRATG